jgi:ethanolamine utilization protein EutA (predicted chaperonin)
MVKCLKQALAQLYLQNRTLMGNLNVVRLANSNGAKVLMIIRHVVKIWDVRLSILTQIIVTVSLDVATKMGKILKTMVPVLN